MKQTAAEKDTETPREWRAANGLLRLAPAPAAVDRKTNTQDSSITKERNQESDEWTTKRRTTREKNRKMRPKETEQLETVARVSLDDGSACNERQMSLNISFNQTSSTPRS
jgi:hypothetical protein